jgi:hypothetical protein
MTNPMTTLGDLIAGGASGAPGRLGVGAAGQVLSVVAGAPAWAAPVATQNLLVNPGVEIWQRSTGPFTTSGVRNADGWYFSNGASSTHTLSRNSANADATTGSVYCARIIYTHVTGASLYAQALEQYAQLRGRTVTFTARVRSSVAGAARLGITDSVATAFGAYHTGGGAYETLSLTATVNAGTTSLVVAVWLGASGTYDVDSAVLVADTIAPTYAPLHPTEEWARCQRYYREYGGLDLFESIASLQAFSTTQTLGALIFPLEMAVAPTLTVSAAADFGLFNAAGTILGCTALTAATITRRGLRIAANVASGLVAGNASILLANNTLAARLRLEATP